MGQGLLHPGLGFRSQRKKRAISRLCSLFQRSLASERFWQEQPCHDAFLVLVGGSEYIYLLVAVCIITFATCSDIMSDQLKVWSAMARSKVNNNYEVMTIMLFLEHRPLTTLLLQ